MVNNILIRNFYVLMKQEFKTQKEFAQFIGLRPESISRIKRTGSIETKTIDIIVNKYPNLNINWLLYDKGDMFLNEPKKAEKKYKIEEPVQAIVSEATMNLNAENTLMMPVDMYVTHLRNELKIIENIMTKIQQTKDVNETPIISELINAGFKEMVLSTNNDRTTDVRDFELGDYTITMDGINVILLHNNTGIDNKPLSIKTIRQYIKRAKK